MSARLSKQKDNETVALRRCLDALSQLSKEQASRVLDYLNARFEEGTEYKGPTNSPDQ